FAANLGSDRPVRWVNVRRFEDFQSAGLIHLPEPQLASLAWRRRWVGQRDFSICGLTHTTASPREIAALAAIPTAPLESWDGLICTSSSVRSMVERLLEESQAYFAETTGAVRFARPQLATLPLGVHPEHFATSLELRQQRRAELGIGDDEPVVLSLSRINLFSKFHPTPLLLALQGAAERLQATVHLVLAGWCAEAGQERLIADAAAALAPGVAVHRVDGQQQRVRREIWSVADVFTLMSDNIQETFGLAPIEAMAAGLPVVAPAWDGLRDTVVDGETGFLVPARAPQAESAPHLGRLLDTRLDYYTRYIGCTAQAISFDVPAATEAFVKLLGNAALRQELGGKGRRLVHEQFAWEHVLGRYEEFWQELHERRRVDAPQAERRPGRSPRYEFMDPYALFASYPTETLDGTFAIAAAAGTLEALDARLPHTALGAFVDLGIEEATVRRTLQRVVDLGQPVTLADLAAQLAMPLPTCILAAGWLLKFDLVEAAP
ncbi:MAG: glycosyltransferase family 4 protein, partial [Planctomycetales bacterium]|nr:glycosyltransferase family 4 protein [Planctomycetales bacterium]